MHKHNLLLCNLIGQLMRLYLCSLLVKCSCSSLCECVCVFVSSTSGARDQKRIINKTYVHTMMWYLNIKVAARRPTVNLPVHSIYPVASSVAAVAFALWRLKGQVREWVCVRVCVQCILEESYVVSTTVGGRDSNGDLPLYIVSPQRQLAAYGKQHTLTIAHISALAIICCNCPIPLNPASPGFTLGLAQFMLCHPASINIVHWAVRKYTKTHT